MTLALYGKSKGRQATLVVAALFAVLLASAGALWYAQTALAHHPTYSTSAACDGTWMAQGSYVAGGDPRIILISGVKVNGANYDPSWASGVGSGSTGPVLLSAYGGTKTGLPADGPGVYVVYADDDDNFTVFNRTQANAGALNLGAGNWAGFIRQYYWNGSSWVEGGTGSGLPSTVNVTAPTAPTNCLDGDKEQSVDGTTFTTSDIQRGPGDTVWYRLTVTNDGPAAAATLVDVQIDDTLPPELGNATLVSQSHAGFCSVSGATVTCGEGATQVDLAPGQSAWVILSSTVDAGECDDFNNTASVDAHGYTGSLNTNRVDVDVRCVPDLEITKTDSPDPVTTGGNITYTITVKNVGAQNVDNDITFSDTVPGNTKLVSVTETSDGGTDENWDCSPDNQGSGSSSNDGIYSTGTPTYTGAISCVTDDRLSPGETTVFTIVVKVDANFCGEITNTATVSDGSGGDTNTANDSATATTQSQGCAPDTVDVRIVKVVTGTDEDANFTFDITSNNGGTQITDGVFSVGNPDPRTLTYGKQYTITEDNPAGVGVGYTQTGVKVLDGIQPDSACPSGASDEWDDAPNSVSFASLTGDKTICFRNGFVEGETDCEGGDLCGLIRSPGFWKNWDNHFTEDEFEDIVAGTGTGLSIAQVEGYLDDNSQQCDRHLMAALLSVSWNPELGTGIWNGSGPYQGMTINAILALADLGNCDEDTDLDDVIRYVGASGENVGPDCLILPPDCYADADLEVDKKDAVIDGTSISWQIEVKNTGTAATSGTITVVDALPDDVTFVSAPDNATWDCEYDAVDHEVTCTTSQVLNAGGDSANNNITINGTIEADVCEEISNSVSVSGGSEPASNVDGKNTDTVRTSVDTCEPSVDVEKTIVGDTGDPGITTGIGTTFQYSIVVTNNGTDTANGVVLSDTDLVGGTFTNVVGTPAPDNCTVPPSSADFTCQLGNMAPGASSEFIVTVEVNRLCQDVTNTAKVHLGGSTTNSAVDSDTAPTVTVTGCLTDLIPEKSQSESSQGSGVTTPIDVDAGQTIYYWLKVTNDSTHTVTNLKIEDTFPAAVTVIDDGDGAGTAATCSLSNGDTELDCELDSLAEDAVWLVKLSMVVPRESAGSECGDDINNVFSVNSDDTSSEPSNQVTANVPDCDPSYTLTKEQSLTNGSFGTGDIAVTAGGSYFYEIVLTNTGNETLADARITDALPLSGEIVSQANSGTGTDTACVTPIAGNTLDCMIDTLYPGATYTIVIEVDVPEAAECESVYLNDASVSFTDTSIPGDTTDEVKATTEDCVPNVKVDKDDNTTDNTVAQGGTFTYTIVVWNEGNDDMEVFLSDELTGPGGITAVDAPGNPDEVDCTIDGDGNGFLCGPFNVPPVAKDQGFVFTVTVQADSGVDACGTLVNRAYVHSVVRAGALIAVGALLGTGTPDDIQVTGCGDPYVEKSVSESIQETEYGQLITYNITVGNHGSSAVTNVGVEDNLTNGVIVSTNNLPAECALKPDDPDPVKTGFSCLFPALAAGASSEFSITVQVSEICEPLDNEIHLVLTGGSFTGGNLNTANDSDTTGNGVTVTGCHPNVGVTKTPDVTQVGYGLTFTYDIVVTNTGNANSGPIDVTDTLTGNGAITAVDVLTLTNDCESNFTGTGFTCSFEDLGFEAPNNTITIRVTVLAGSQSCADIDNAAQVVSTGSQQNGTSTNVSDTEGNLVDVINCEADPAVEKTTTSTVVQLNSSFTYDITVSNLGNEVASNVILTDTLTGAAVTSIASADGDFDCEASGAFPCTIGELGIGETVTFTVTVEANGECLPVNNTAFVQNAGAGGDSNTSNNEDAAPQVDVDGCEVDVDGSKEQATEGLAFTASAISLDAAQVVQYRVTATNEGNQVLHDVSITDNAPPGTAFKQIVDNGGGVCVGDGPFTCTIDTLGVGASYTIVFEVVVANVHCGISVSNTAAIIAGSSGTSGTGPGTASESTNTVEGEMEPCGSIIVDKTTVVNGSVNGAFDAGWTITIECDALNLTLSAETGANGVAIFTDLPACDWVVTELTGPDDAPFPGFTPDGSPVVEVGLNPGGVATVNFVNVSEDEEPTPTPTATNTSVPTNTPTQPVAGETVVNTATPTNTTTAATPSQTVAGSTVVATGTPLAPSTGNGLFGSGSGSNMTLAIFGMLAVAGGFILIAFGRRTRNEA